MTIQLKNDIKTIIELFIFIILSFSLTGIYEDFPWVGIVLFIIGGGAVIYKSYFLRLRTDTILFPTLNDDNSRITFVTFGIIILFFAVVGYFVFNLNVYQCIFGVTIGAAISLFGFFQSPRGWLTIENNSLKIYGVDGIIDIRQLKEIVLVNDKITLTNIYGEHKYSALLKLTPFVSGNIKKFIDDKLQKGKVQVIDDVTGVI